MSEPLTTKRFDEFVEAYTQNHGAILKRFDKIDERLGRIERHLWNEQRLEEHERRLIELAETVGRPDLATPFARPIGG